MSFKLLAVVLSILIAGCGRSKSTGVERVAILPFENLSSRPDLDWIGPVIPVIVARQAVGAPGVVTVSMATEHEFSSQRITRVIRGYYQMENGNLRVRATLHELATSRAAGWFDARGPLDQGPAPLVAGLSRQFTGKADTFTGGREALAMLGSALATPDAGRRAELATAAFQKDPQLTAAALEAAPLRAAQGAGAEAVAMAEAAVKAAPSDWDRAQAAMLAGFLHRNRDEITKALEAAARISPANADLARQLGELAARRNDFRKAAEWFTKATEAEPGYIGLWNLRAYAQAYAADFAAAKQSTARYRELAPADPNAYDTSGEILWMAGEFAEASRSFVQGQEKDPQFNGGLEFSKAAFALWMAGDVAAADAMFQRYLESRRALSDPIVDLRQAHWLLLTGRGDRAFALAGKVAEAGGEIGSRALSFVSFWQTQMNRRDQARDSAAKALPLARSPGSQNMAALAGLFAQPKAPAGEWRERIGRIFAGQAPAAFHASALMYVLFLDGHYAEASKLAQAILAEATPGTVDEILALRGGAQLLSGDKAGAAQTLIRWPLPPQPGESLFASLWFPAVKEWRAQLGK